MVLPSPIAGLTTETVGLFRCDARRLALWLAAGLGQEWVVRPACWESVEALGHFLEPGQPSARHVLVPWGHWTAMLTDGPLGTDVGMLPSLAAREIDCMAIRATAVGPESDRFGAVVLEVFDPSSTEDLLRCRRSISAADDGWRWVFSQVGVPFEFEDLGAYGRRRIRDRFTPAMLNEYLRSLGVPVDADLGLADTQIVERAR